MTGLIARIRAALRLHFLRGRRAQLQQGIDTLEACIRDDQALVAHMRRELRVIDARMAAAQPDTARTSGMPAGVR